MIIKVHADEQGNRDKFEDGYQSPHLCPDMKMKLPFVINPQKSFPYSMVETWVNFKFYKLSWYIVKATVR